MNIKHIVITALFLGGIYTTAQAQYLQEIIRFSQPEYGASARIRALANAQTAIGGDISSIAGNPAGLGFFSQSDISITLDYMSNVNKASYFGTNSQNNVDKLGFNQAGVVFHIPTQRARGSSLETGWLNFNVGIAYSKTNNFNSTIGYTGINVENSVGDFMSYEDGFAHGNFGWESGMIDENAAGDLVPMTTLDNSQTVYNKEKGFQSETNISFGANYSNKLYLGGSIGFSRINNEMNYLFMEDGFIENYNYIFTQNPNSRFVDEGDANFDIYNRILDAEFNYDNETWSRTNGNGVNAKLGLIYKPVNQLQIGLTATTPTWYNLTNEFTDYFLVDFFNIDGSDDFHEYPEETVYYDYRLRTPYRLSGGLAWLFGGGLVSADVEYVDYASTRFTSDDGNTDQSNNDEISTTLQGAVNLRVGAEYMVAPSILLRAGYANMGNPYQNKELSNQTVTAGLGYRVNNIYIDVTYQNFSQKYGINPYILDDANNNPSPQASIKNNRSSVFLTLGAKF